MTESARAQAKRLGVRWRDPVQSYAELIADVDRRALTLQNFLRIYLINPADVERLVPRRKGRKR